MKQSIESTIKDIQKQTRAKKKKDTTDTSDQYLLICSGGVKKFNDLNLAIEYARKKESDMYFARIYKTISVDEISKLDLLQCVYYTGCEQFNVII